MKKTEKTSKSSSSKVAEEVKQQAAKHGSQRIQEDDRDFQLSRKEARGGSPADVSIGGEEDAGVGLEFLVRKDTLSGKKKKSP